MRRSRMAALQGGVVVIEDPLGVASSRTALVRLNDLLRGEGASVASVRAVGELTSTLWSDTRTRAMEEVRRLERDTGMPSCVIGVELGALVAIDLALDGRVDAVVAWGPNLEVTRMIGSAWSEARQAFVLDDGVIPGAYAALQPLRDSVESLRSRELPVPGLIVSDLLSDRAVDARWLGKDDLPHQWLRVSVGERGDVAREHAPGTGWSASDSAGVTSTWLSSLERIALRTRPRDDTGRLVNPASSPPEGRGSIFISYRHNSEATHRANHIRSHLTAAGFRVFLDHFSLEPADIRATVDRAISDDCSGGVLVLTEDVPDSSFIIREELTRLLAHSTRHRVPLAIDNTIRQSDHKDLIDPRAPLRLLGLDEGSLDNFVQYDLLQQTEDNYGIDALIRSLLGVRMEGLRGGTISLDIQTYPGLDFDFAVNKASDLRIRAELNMRRSVADHAQRQASLGRLKLALPLIGEALHSATPERIVVTGGAHAPVAMALGGLLSSRRVQCPVILENKNGQVWGLPGARDPHLNKVEAPLPFPIKSSDASSSRVAVLVAGSETDPSLFTTLLERLSAPIAAAALVTFAGPPDGGGRKLHPDEGLRVARDLGSAITGFARQKQAQEILLCFSLNFELAVLLGRLLNKYRVVVYDLIDKSWYQRMIALDRVDAQIESVFPDDPYSAQAPKVVL